MIAPGVVHLARRPARRLLRVPALLRPGTARRLGEVMAASRDRRLRARRLHGVPDAAPRRLEPEEIAVFGTRRRPGRRLAAAGRGDPAARDALRERRPLPADVVPRPRGPRRRARRRSLRPLVAAVCDRYHPTRRRVPRARRASCASGAAGTGASRAARSSASRAVDGGFELDGHGVFRHVLLAPGHPGLNVPEELRGRPARRPRVRAARVRGDASPSSAPGWRRRPSG